MAGIVATGLQDEGDGNDPISRARGSLLQLLQLRFGTLPTPLLEQINSTSDPTRLKDAMDRACRIPTLEGFEV